MSGQGGHNGSSGWRFEALRIYSSLKLDSRPRIFEDPTNKSKISHLGYWGPLAILSARRVFRIGQERSLDLCCPEQLAHFDAFAQFLSASCFTAVNTVPALPTHAGYMTKLLAVETLDRTTNPAFSPEGLKSNSQTPLE